MGDTQDSGERRIVFELCAETLAPCLMARRAGVARLELCADLLDDGLTPAPALVREVVAGSGLPVHIMVRPRAGDFCYSDTEFARMQDQVRAGLALGVSGFVLGLLHRDGTVDEERTGHLVELAEGREVTFHRAFDRAKALPEALEAVVRTGCHRVLTSGGAPDVWAGSSMLRGLVVQAAGRIAIAAGGGLRAEFATELARTTGVRQFHGTVRRETGNGSREVRVDSAEVERLIEALERGAAMASEAAVH